MLAIRMQRTGRKGHAQFRVVVQDSRQTPTSGRVIFNLGTYNPHTKESKLNTDKASFYLKNGAQPSPRVSALLKEQGVKLPSWVTVATKKETSIKNSDKLRKNRPAEPVAAATEAPESPDSPEATEAQDKVDEPTAEVPESTEADQPVAESKE